MTAYAAIVRRAIRTAVGHLTTGRAVSTNTAPRISGVCKRRDPGVRGPRRGPSASNLLRFRGMRTNQSGRIGYVVLYLLGAPVGLLIVLWLLLGNNIFGPG
jgi:hypothetical protein